MKTTVNYTCQLLLLLMVLFKSTIVNAQVLPQPNALIKHTQVLYEFDAVPEADSYSLKVYKLPERKLVVDKQSEHPAILVHELLDFGASYEWIVTAMSQKRVFKKIGPYRFSIAQQPKANPLLTKIDVTTDIPDGYMQGIVIIDNGFVVNRSGQIVYVFDKTLTLPRATDITPQKTFVYVDSIYAIERDYSGKVLWKSRLYKTDTMNVAAYHHDIIKTSRGTNMVMAILNYPKLKQQVKYSGILEIDSAHNIVWFWSEKDFYPNDSLRFKASHANSLFYDEEHGKIYVSKRDLNSIIRIDKQTGQVDYSYGWNIDSVVPYYINPYFKMQHRVRKLSNGNLLIYNNDSTESSDLARTKVMEITDPELGEADLVWEYVFDFQNPLENFVSRMGGAVELSNNNMLISTGIFDRVFEVNREGQIVWECRTTIKKAVTDKQDFAPSSYRANFKSSLFPYHSKLYMKIINGQKRYVLYNAGSESQAFEVKFANETAMILDLGANSYHLFDAETQKLEVKSLVQMQVLRASQAD